MQLRIAMTFRVSPDELKKQLPANLAFIKSNVQPMSLGKDYSKVRIEVSEAQKSEAIKWGESTRLKNGATIAANTRIDELYEIGDCSGDWVEFTMHTSQSDSVAVVDEVETWSMPFQCEACDFFELTQVRDLNTTLDISINDPDMSTHIIESKNQIMYVDRCGFIACKSIRPIFERHGVRFRKVKGAEGYEQALFEGRMPLVLDIPLMKVKSEPCKKCGASDMYSRNRTLQGPELPHDKEEKEFTLLMDYRRLTVKKPSGSYPLCIDVPVSGRPMPPEIHRTRNNQFWFMSTALAKDLFAAKATGITVYPVNMVS